jgi:flagellin
MRINQNVMANNASRNLSGTNVMLGKSLEKLSSGFRINRAADDAAGLVVSQNLRSQIGGLKQATRNAQDGISVVQTAEGALNEVHTMLGRMRDLAVQAANSGGNDTAARTAAQTEITQLSAEITRTSDKTRFGGVNLLDGSYGKTAGKLTALDANNSIAVTAGDTINLAITGGSASVSVALSAGTFTGAQFASMVESAVKGALNGTGNAVDAAAANGFTATATTVGAGSAITLSNGSAAAIAVTDGTGTPLVDALGAANPLIGTITAASGSGGTFQIGANSGDTLGISIADTDATALGVASLDVTTDAGAAAAITALDAAISTVSTTRGDLGAKQNRFESMINNLQVSTENITASESRIRDTDMAQEMVTFTKNQVLQQAGTAMLSQANQIPQSILSLLR